MITIEICNRQSHLPLDEPRLRRAVEMILQDASVSQAEISLAVVDDPTIRRLHCKYLDRDEPTDVLSFVLNRDQQHLEGEVIVSAETAAAAAPEFAWPAEDELLLYVIHGTLHLVGHEDTAAKQRAEMRWQERAYLARFGLKHSDETLGDPAAPLKDSPSAGENDP